MRGKKAKGSYSRQIDDTLELTAITSATAAADPQADDNLKVDVFSPTRVGPAPRGRCVSACCCCIGRRCRQTRRLVCLVLVLMTFEVAYELTELLGSCSNRPQLVHIPKTGGTAMMYVGLMNNIFWGGFAWRGLCQKEWKDAPWAQEDLPPRFYGGANATFIATASTTFCAVRDPLSRLLSAYRYVLPLHSPALRGGTDAEGGTARAILSPGAEILLPSCNASKMADIRNGEWWLTDAWCDPGVASGLLSSLLRAANTPQLLNYTAQYWTMLASHGAGVGSEAWLGGLWRTPTHLIPQHYYLSDTRGAPTCSHVLRTENLTDGFNNLMGELGLGARLPADSARPARLLAFAISKIMTSKRTEARDRSAMKPGERDHSLDFYSNSHAGKVCPHLTVGSLSEELLSVAACVYAGDYAAFGYPRPSPTRAGMGHGSSAVSANGGAPPCTCQLQAGGAGEGGRDLWIC
jgi:hypothetical protein